jgi:hypothetical protein
MENVVVIVPNLNGMGSLEKCIDSVLAQSRKNILIVIENGSTDNSLAFLKKNSSNIEIIENAKNLGFAGGVNQGIKKAIDIDAEFIALFNNDAVANKDWLENLVKVMVAHGDVGVVAPKILSSSKKQLDSAGDMYTSWGLPYPKGRKEYDGSQYDKPENIFSASGGASLYRVSMLKEIGLFDNDFFAYYEDVDISFRAQLAGWKILYEPSAVAYHEIGATSSKIPGFTTYQTIKNLPWLFWKNVPRKYLFSVGVRFYLAYFLFILSAISRGQLRSVIKGLFVSVIFMPKKLIQRQKIQSSAKVSPEYIWSIMTHDLPPNAIKLRKIRSFYHKLIKKA